MRRARARGGRGSRGNARRASTRALCGAEEERERELREPAAPDAREEGVGGPRQLAERDLGCQSRVECGPAHRLDEAARPFEPMRTLTEIDLGSLPQG